MLKKFAFTSLLALFVLLALAACQPAPSQKITIGNTLLSDDFSSAGSWDTFSDPTKGLNFNVENGVYRLQANDAGYVWGLNRTSHTNAVIEAQAMQNSDFANNAYGIICRADKSNNGDGYYFLISGDGYYSIRKGTGTQVTALVDWTRSSSVNQGKASNTLRAVCVNDYLALFVNGNYVGETHDSTYTEGYVGFTTTAFNGGTVDITFDNLTVKDGSIASS